MVAKRQAPEIPSGMPQATLDPAAPVAVTPVTTAVPAAPGPADGNQASPTMSSWVIQPKPSPITSWDAGAGQPGVVSTISPPLITKSPKATTRKTSSTAYSEPTTSTQPNQLHNSGNISSSGYSSGILAGAIVASVIGSAFLALLAAYFFFGRRRSKKGNSQEDSHTREALRDKNYDSETPSSRGHLSGTRPYSGIPDNPTIILPHALHAERGSLGDYIPTPADDKTVQSRVLTVFDHLALHVENYYSCSSPLNLDSSESTQDVAMINSYNSTFLPAPVASLLLQSNDREPIIKHCLLQSIIPLIFYAISSPFRSEGNSFLPPIYAVSRYFRDIQLHQDQVASQVQFHWRMLTAHGYRGIPTTQKQAYISARGKDISRAVETFTTAFRSYASPHHPESERIRHLTKVMEDAAELGIWLFEQPCGYEFIWDDVPAGKVVVSPAMVKVFDEQGRQLKVTKTIIKADVARYM
ncbi:hypothetical protein McanMca71_001237 [Microsporum canis]|uniref:Uncharacterized protein n=1 Tax=Arthroderma otae (strain ATCC MYA-4605 / CBS 113480) TaxID=554155 RepID=C5FHE7_ARTOC|nr:conserved hypothetical protein [Microsporum canis CBS 113480]EEQ28687.1 conserved hypothetical protein [Microsporum canis CBS 113480]